jgi:hypothetical protein
MIYIIRHKNAFISSCISLSAGCLNKQSRSVSYEQVEQEMCHLPKYNSG